MSEDLQITLNLFSEFKGIFVLRNDGPYEKTGKMEPGPFDFESFWYFKWLPDGEASELENSGEYDTGVISKGGKILENQCEQTTPLCSWGKTGSYVQYTEAFEWLVSSLDV